MIFSKKNWNCDVKFELLKLLTHYVHSRQHVASQWTHPGWFAIDSMSKFHLESSSKWHRFKRRTDVEIMTSIWRRIFDVDSIFKIDKSSMSPPRGAFDVVSTSNRRNICTRCFHCIISQYFLLWEPILSCSGIVLSGCDFNNIDVITDIGIIGTISFGNFCNNANK